MSGDRRVEIRRQDRLLDDFFKVDEIIVAHQRHDGRMSADQRRLVFDRGDAIAVLLFDANVRSVILVEQFRLPALIARRRDSVSTSDGWMTELVAGMIDADETPEQAAIRETFEETGYRIVEPRRIGQFFSSPGGSSERFTLYFAPVSEAQRDGNGGGVAGEEDIRVFKSGVEQLFTRLAQGAIDDPKLAIAAYWLKDNIHNIERATLK